MSEYEEIDEDLEDTLKLYEVSVVHNCTYVVEIEALDETDAQNTAIDNFDTHMLDVDFEDTYIESIKELS